VLRHAAEVCQSAILVLRPTIRLEVSGAAILTALLPFERRREDSTSWPGTELFFGETASVIEFELNEPVLEILARAPGLFAWVQPSLPEDLCLLRADGSAWLTTIAHERAAYLQLRVGELASLSAVVPSLKLERRDQSRLNA